MSQALATADQSDERKNFPFSGKAQIMSMIRSYWGTENWF
jgi:hypothetical protein